MTTRITESNIQPGSVSANIFLAGVTFGPGVTIDQIIVTDSNFANTSDTEILATGGYLKLYGSGFQANANAYISTSFALSTQVTANIVSNNEIRLTIGSTTAATYNLFLFNRNGSTATRLSSVTTVQRATAGWFGGGGPGPISIVDRITFSTDTATASVRGPLSSTRYALAATGNFNFGWFGSGSGDPGRLSRVDRITFAADTNTASVRGPLSSAKNYLAATGNDNFGWFGGGFPGPTLSTSLVDRITFTSDTSTAATRGTLSLARRELNAFGNSNFGWFAGGVPGPVSRVDRIDFAADTGTASVRGPLSSAKEVFSSTGNDNFGWFGGGSPAPSPVSTVDRIDFAADTGTASVRGPLSLARRSLAATGNDNFGWFAGGLNPSFPIGITSTVERITFADDTVTGSLRGPLSTVNRNSDATSGIA